MHLTNAASLTKIKRPNASPCPLFADGDFDKTRKATALRSLEFGLANPIKYHFFRIGVGSAKSVLLMFCSDISSSDNGIASLGQYHDKAGSPDSRKEADVAFFTREYERRKKLEDVRLKLCEKKQLNIINRS